MLIHSACWYFFGFWLYIST